MNSKQVRSLQSGNVVHWNDPDNGICSRTLKIKTIEVMEDEEENDEDHVLSIIDEDGSELDCLASELSLIN